MRANGRQNDRVERGSEYWTAGRHRVCGASRRRTHDNRVGEVGYEIRSAYRAFEFYHSRNKRVPDHDVVQCDVLKHHSSVADDSSLEHHSIFGRVIVVGKCAYEVVERLHLDLAKEAHLPYFDAD